MMPLTVAVAAVQKALLEDPDFYNAFYCSVLSAIRELQLDTCYPETIADAVMERIIGRPQELP